MDSHERRITLICRQANKPDVDWNYRCENVAFLDSTAALKFAIRTSVLGSGLDIERVIVDRAGSSDDFLDLLASIPAELAGDVLLIRDDRSGFLSATGRGCDRVLYALAPQDIRFYLEAQDLVTGRAALSLTA